MQKNLRFDENTVIKVQEETLKGLLFHINPMKDDGGTDVVCDIADLNKIALDITIKRQSGKEIFICKGYLHETLLALYGQTTKLELNTKKTSAGYLVFVDLTPAVIKLMGKDELVVDVNIPKTAFTGTTVSKSSITFQTMSAFGESRKVPVVKSHVIGKDETAIDMDLGDNVFKIVCATDFSEAYDASTEAKLVNGDIKADGFEKAFTESQLLAENMHFFDNNPESDVEDLVPYWGDFFSPLNRVKFRAKLDQGANVKARVLTLQSVSAR